jgi:hypothetical protein
MNMVLISLGIILMSSPAFAGAAISVPEIDGLSGLAAIGAVGGISALIWERRRRK